MPDVQVVTMATPPFPPSLLSDWIQPGALLTAVFGLAAFFWTELKSLKAELKADMQASEARSSQKIDEVKAELKEIKADIKTLLLAQAPQRPSTAKS